MKCWKYYQGLFTYCRGEGSSDCRTNIRKGGQRPTTPWRRSNLGLSRNLRLEREKPLNRNIHKRNGHSVWITTLPHSKHKTNLWEVKELNTDDKNFKLLEIKTEEFFMNTGSKHFFPKSPTSDRKSYIGLGWTEHGKEMRQEQLWLKGFHQMISKNNENKNTESPCISS